MLLDYISQHGYLIVIFKPKYPKIKYLKYSGNNLNIAASQTARHLS